MKEQIKTPVVVVVVLAVVGLIAWLGMKGFSAGDLDQGQVKYTPGKPPWEETDPAKRGPGGAPPGAAPAPGAATDPGAATAPGAVITSGGPPGMAPPVVNNK